jgi:hypothetical protein
MQPAAATEHNLHCSMHTMMVGVWQAQTSIAMTQMPCTKTYHPKSIKETSCRRPAEQQQKNTVQTYHSLLSSHRQRMSVGAGTP